MLGVAIDRRAFLSRAGLSRAGLGAGLGARLSLLPFRAFAESEQMVKALAECGVQLTYVVFSDQGHGFVRPENRLAFTAVTEAFLAKHLGGRVQPVGGDFAGSTIAIPVGRDLVPGLPVSR